MRRISRNTSNENENNLCTLASSLITDLEHLDAQDLEKKDQCKSETIVKVHGAICLNPSDIFTKNSKYVNFWCEALAIEDLVSITMYKERIILTCICTPFQATNECEHNETVVNKLEYSVRIRIFSD